MQRALVLAISVELKLKLALEVKPIGIPISRARPIVKKAKLAKAMPMNLNLSR
jgi:hypothetical protein